MSAIKTTKAWIVDGQTGFDDLRFDEQTPLEKVGDHEVLVKVHAVSLNYRDVTILKVSISPQFIGAH